VEALRIKEVKGETHKTLKIDGFQRVPLPTLERYCAFWQVFFESHPIYDQTQGIGAVFS